MIPLPPIPQEIKHIAHFLKVADEHDDRNVVVSYWCRMYACQVAMKTTAERKSVEVTALLVAVMDWLELAKKQNLDSDGISNETAAQALIEQYAMQLFQYADTQDQAGNFGKNVVKAFYTTGILMDVLQQFGDLNEDIFNKRKYAKWKAAYIHNCLKNGERPMPGPPTERNLLEDSDEDEEDENMTSQKHFNNHPTNLIIPATHDSSSSDAPLISGSDNLPPVPFPGHNSQSQKPFSSTNIIQPSPTASSTVLPSVSSDVVLSPEQIEKAQKYCKFAGSALTYDDIKTAVDNLQKALHLLQFATEKQ